MEKVELVFQVCIQPVTMNTLTCAFLTGPSSITIRGISGYENVWTGKNQCEFTDLPDQQEILWHIGSFIINAVCDSVTKLVLENSLCFQNVT